MEPSKSSDFEPNTPGSTPQADTGKRISKRRVRTGCLNCRRKHKKCDESKPICTTCLSKNETCEWPILKSKMVNHQQQEQLLPPSANQSLFYPSQDFDPSTSKNQTIIDPNFRFLGIIQQSFPQALSPQTHLQATQAQTPLQLRTPVLPQQNFPYIPSGVHVPQSYQPGWTQMSSILEPIPPRKTFETPELYQHYQNLEALLLRFLTDPEPIANLPGSMLNTDPLNSFEEITTMKYYQYSIAPQFDWMDTNTTTFRIEVPHLSRSSNVLRNGIYASSLIHQSNDLNNPNPIQMSRILSIFENSLLELVKDPQQGNIPIRVSSAFFLVEFCLNIAPDPVKWRSLVGGLLSYLQREAVHPREKNPTSHGVYWMAILLDICCTKVFEESTLVAHDVQNLEGLTINTMTLGYVSMAINLLELNQPQVDFDSKWEQIWVNYNLYISESAEQGDKVAMGPLMDRADENSPFPMILQSSRASVMCQQFYLVLKILLIQDRPRVFLNKHNDPHQAAWYAKRLCSISLWNKEYTNWIATPFSLVIAGKLLTHEDEHQVIVTMLDEIRANSGYMLKHTKQDLLEYWGS